MGVKFTKKLSERGKMEKKMSKGGKIGGENCLRGFNLDKTVLGSQEKNISEGGKKSCILASKWLRYYAYM